MSLERDSHKSELNKVVRSKDQIIVEYKNQVQQLQCNMSLAPPQSHSQIHIHSQQVNTNNRSPMLFDILTLVLLCPDIYEVTVVLDQ